MALFFTTLHLKFTSDILASLHIKVCILRLTNTYVFTDTSQSAWWANVEIRVERRLLKSFRWRHCLTLGYILFLICSGGDGSWSLQRLWGGCFDRPRENEEEIFYVKLGLCFHCKWGIETITLHDVFLLFYLFYTVLFKVCGSFLLTKCSCNI